MEKPDIGSKASGFYKFLQKFDSYFLLIASTEIFERIEMVSAALQENGLMFSKVIKLIKNSKDVLGALRQEDKFKVQFPNVISDVKELKENIF